MTSDSFIKKMHEHSYSENENDARNNFYEFLRKNLPDSFYQWFKNHGSTYKKIDYDSIVNQKIIKKWNDKIKTFPVVFPSWDNTARRSTPTIIENNDEAIYKKWLISSFEKIKSYDESEQVVFVNAWNEWAEGWRGPE